MKQWTSTDEILDYAISCEEEAVKFYTDLAGQAKDSGMRTIFESYAKEEEGHKQKLLGIKSSGTFGAATEKVLDLKISDYLVEVEQTGDLSYQDALILAMKREKAAFKLYTDMAASSRDPELKSILQGLAQEEAKHKLHFEVTYDEEILTEN